MLVLLVLVLVLLLLLSGLQAVRELQRDRSCAAMQLLLEARDRMRSSRAVERCKRRRRSIVAILEPRADVATQYTTLVTPPAAEEATEETVVADVEPVAAEAVAAEAVAAE